ncbi:3-dehydroquinate synthase [Aquimarina brevivitae]|uniref:3-dehydroquinate synthase n=1 Tax=Aquimarina brevivitae TaxID=323412 RepID=A0A4Q7P1I2_9FLAO|nr:3-dehydroquinate synthase [Aquimarina brevivitae]RZS93703.1 3-dehydroquinate synthase [Aquimarina brevivitae]
MKPIVSKDSIVYFNTDGYTNLNTYLEKSKPSKIFVLVDSNTHQFCLSYFLGNVKGDYTIEIIEIEAGEIHKNIETCTGVWNVLSELGADRKSLMINLGGGVVTDLGGFVACTFKRGIPYINIPTSLLAMVDASVGGKTGVDLGNLKNMVGVISESEMVLVDSTYLSTLPADQMRSGLAEMLKHGLIADKSYWKKLTDLANLTTEDLTTLIYESVEIKNKIVKEDPREQNIRKYLNFGHTLGHAIESFYLTHSQKPTLLHGEAIAIGMITEAFLSKELLTLTDQELNEIASIILNTFPKVDIDEKDYEAILKLLIHDKKNEGDTILFVLLEEIGKAKYNCTVPNSLLTASLNYYKSL